MHLLALKTYFHNNLLGYYPNSEIQSFFRLLCEFNLGYKPVDIVLNEEKEILAKNYHFFQDTIERLQVYEPIQYILGETNFYGHTFNVNTSVLIPRPETEELVDWIIKDYKNEAIRILDIGTGSGCIPITLAKHLPKAVVFSLDVSKEALKIAKENATLNQVEVHFIEGDILSADTATNLLKESRFDVIVSNPPYVRSSEKDQMKENVLNYEPHIALFVADNDALVFYKRIVALSETLLVKGGAMYFEINEALGLEVQELMDLIYDNIEIRKDILGKDRMVKGIKR